MADPRVQKLARVLVGYSVSVKKGDVVVIQSTPPAEPLVLALQREVLEAGGHPWIRLVPEEAAEIHFRHAADHQLAHVNPFDARIVKEANVTIRIAAEQNKKALSRVDPAKQAAASRARGPLMQIGMKRGALPKGDPKKLRWNVTRFPTQAAAQSASMSLSDYEDFIYAGCKIHQRDPVAAWKKLGESQKRLADLLTKGKELHVTAPNGTDIRYGIEGRTWINCDGHENFPDGEVFTGPIEDATEGTVVYDEFPAVYGGREVDGIRLVFKAGKVVEATARHNEEFLHRMLDQDKGARVLGELAIGTNYSIRDYTKDTLFDEKIGGTFHAALGQAYPESGGKNRSALHWDLVCELRKGGEIRLDGKVIQRNGRFLDKSFPR